MEKAKIADSKKVLISIDFSKDTLIYSPSRHQ